MYKDTDPASGFENDGRPFPVMNERDREDARKVYAMVTNIDDNIGKLLRKLDELKLSDNTLIIFMTDNGPQQRRYVAGMRGLKGSVYNGGIRVPCFIRYPGLLKGSGEVGTNTAYIDIMPTIAEVCHAGLPADMVIDGKSLLPLITGKPREWQARPLFFYWTRKYPEFYNNVALLKDNYKLAGHTGYDSDISRFELFDLSEDPYEQNNIVKEKTDVAISLKDDLDRLFQELINSPNLTDPPCTVLGSDHENPLFLSRNDAGGDRGIWDQEEVNGKWRVRFTEGEYNLRFRFVKPVKGNGQMVLETKSFINQKINTIDQAEEIEMNGIHFPEMECDLVPYYLVDSKSIFPFWVEVERIK
jgi:arylsulfatase